MTQISAQNNGKNAQAGGKSAHGHTKPDACDLLMAETIADRLRIARRVLGKTQREIAKAIGGNHRSWQDYESGKSVPGGAVFAALATELGFNTNWLLTGDGPMYQDGAPKPDSRLDGSVTSSTGEEDIWKYLRREFLSRLATAIGGEKLEDFEARARLRPNSLAYIVGGQQSATRNDIAAIAKAAGVSVDWLVKGAGQEPSLVPIRAYRDVAAGAGPGQPVFDESSSPLALPVSWFKANGVKSDQVACLLARGDSMEPTIRDGDQLIIRLYETISDAVFVLRFDGELVVKRVQRVPGATVNLISDNPTSPTIVVRKGDAIDLKVIGRVIVTVKRQ